MMMHRALLVLAAAACAAAVPARSAAQQAFGPSVEAGVGVFEGLGGYFHHRAGPALDAVLALPVGRAGRSTVVAGVTAGISGPMGGDLICVVGPQDECMPDYPTFFSMGAVAGIQREVASGFSARVLAGAAKYQSVDGPDVVGFQGRVDVARPLVFHTALVASLRAAVLPGYEGETLTMTSFGLGLRIQ